jgi:hypothetical protein
MLSIWFKYPELWLIFLIVCICSLHLVWKFDLFALHILVGNPCISFDKCKSFCTYLFVSEVLLCCIICIMFCIWKAIFVCVFQRFCDFSHFFSAVCQSSPFSFLVLWISVILFLFMGMFLVWFYIIFSIVQCIFCDDYLHFLCHFRY